MAIKWTNKSAINREIEMAERHTDPARLIAQGHDYLNPALHALAFTTEKIKPSLVSNQPLKNIRAFKILD